MGSSEGSKSFDSYSAEGSFGIRSGDSLDDADLQVDLAAGGGAAVPPALGAAGYPVAREPVEQEPLVRVSIPELSFKAVRDLFSASDWPVVRFLKAEYDAYDFFDSGWFRDDRGKHARQTRLQMPTPADVPRALIRLTGAPDHASSTMDFGGCFEADHMVYVQRTTTQGILYSEHFRVWDTFSFRPQSSGGTLLMRWTEVEWVRELPWTQSMIKYFVEKKTMESAKASTKTLVRILTELAQ